MLCQGYDTGRQICDLAKNFVVGPSFLDSQAWCERRTFTNSR
jgi:hypothetical protein